MKNRGPNIRTAVRALVFAFADILFFVGEPHGGSSRGIARSVPGEAFRIHDEAEMTAGRRICYPWPPGLPV